MKICLEISNYIGMKYGLKNEMVQSLTEKKMYCVHVVILCYCFMYVS